MMERLALHSGLNDHSSDQGMGGDQDEDDEVLLHDEDSSDDYDEGDEDRDSDDSEMFYTSEDDDVRSNRQKNDFKQCFLFPQKTGVYFVHGKKRRRQAHVSGSCSQTL